MTEILCSGRRRLQVEIARSTVTALTTLPDTILLRRARPVFSATLYKDFYFYLRPDFGQGTTVIYDAYMQYNHFKKFKVRAGKFKSPVGLERLQEDDNTTFVERGFPTLLVPSRDIGFQVGGDIIDRRVTYAVGVFNGVPDNGLSDAAVSDHRDYAARLFLTPFQPDEKNILRGLGLGIGASSGSVDGIALPSYKSFGQNSFITFASGVASDGHRDRLAPQAYYYLGPFGLLAEYGVNEEGFQKGAVRHDIALRAWQTEVSYILTGEHKVFGNLIPRRNFDPEQSWLGCRRNRRAHRRIQRRSRPLQLRLRDRVHLGADREGVGRWCELVLKSDGAHFGRLRRDQFRRRRAGRKPAYRAGLDYALPVELPELPATVTASSKESP